MKQNNEVDLTSLYVYSSDVVNSENRVCCQLCSSLCSDRVDYKEFSFLRDILHFGGTCQESRLSKVKTQHEAGRRRRLIFTELHGAVSLFQQPSLSSWRLALRVLPLISKLKNKVCHAAEGLTGASQKSRWMLHSEICRVCQCVCVLPETHSSLGPVFQRESVQTVQCHESTRFLCVVSWTTSSVAMLYRAELWDYR
jgi:hypothetical protein